MKNLSLKIKKHYKKAALFISLFVVIFFGLFYLVNMDLTSSEKTPAKITTPTNFSYKFNFDEEIKKRIGSTSLYIETYNEWGKRFGVWENSLGLDNDIDKDGLPNYLEYLHGTNPLSLDTDGDKYSDKQEIANGYDPDASLGDPKLRVEIIIPKINISAPMIWSKSEVEKDMLKDLENGLGHFDRTAAPGQRGNAVISGHSSNYIWAKGNYNHIFKDLNKLEKGDEIIAKTYQENGRIIVYRYRVTDKFTTLPDDEEIFANTTEATLTLSTCWPLGTNFKRLIVKAEIVK